MDKKIGSALAALRIVLGAGFLYAGLDKAVHFDGSAKAFSAAGFLKGATAGTLPGSAEGAIVNPTHPFWASLGANADLVTLVNFLVVAGEIAIGAALILGLATRFAAVMGTLMMALFWIASWDFAHGLVNEQFLYGAVAAFIAVAAPVQAFAVDKVIETTALVRRAPALRYVLG
jgi:thiosulfate dehydrogenase [quinone] large subunit